VASYCNNNSWFTVEAVRGGWLCLARWCERAKPQQRVFVCPVFNILNRWTDLRERCQETSKTTVFIMFYPPVFLTAFLCVPATSSHTSRRLKFWLPRVCEARSLRGGVQLSFCGVLHKHDRGCYHVLSLKSSVHDSWCVVFATFLMFHGTSMIFNVKRCVQVIS
jgi:hypothetical protein